MLVENPLNAVDAQVLKRGKWEQVFRERRENGLPYGKTTGKKWDSIGGVCGPIGQEPDHLHKLPGSFEALYQLSRLGPTLLRRAIQDGAVHPGLNETTAREVAQQYNPKLKRRPRQFNTRRFLAKTQAGLGLLLASKRLAPI